MRRAFVGLHQELASHLMKEEQILFPMIRQLESSAGVPAFHCGSVANPIGQMEHEHDSAGNALAVMRASTDGYQAPEWACNTYHAMLDGLKQLEWDLHQHIHKENNVLFPKAIRREAALAAGRLVLAELDRLAQARVDFAFESTLSGLVYATRLKRWKIAGYWVHLVFLRVPSAQLALRRIAARVRQGGHDVPKPDVVRRFERSWQNFVKVYQPLADAWTLYDTSAARPQLVERGP